jgi:hypothetical protein
MPFARARNAAALRASAIAVHRLEQKLRETAAALAEARGKRNAVQRERPARRERSRAMAIALCSRWPPPIVPSIPSR